MTWGDVKWAARSGRGFRVEISGVFCQKLLELRAEVKRMQDALDMAHRAIRALLQACGTSPECRSTTALHDADGYFVVDCDRGVVSTTALDAAKETDDE